MRTKRKHLPRLQTPARKLHFLNLQLYSEKIYVHVHMTCI